MELHPMLRRNISRDQNSSLLQWMSIIPDAAGARTLGMSTAFCNVIPRAICSPRSPTVAIGGTLRRLTIGWQRDSSCSSFLLPALKRHSAKVHLIVLARHESPDPNCRGHERPDPKLTALDGASGHGASRALCRICGEAGERMASLVCLPTCNLRQRFRRRRLGVDYLAPTQARSMGISNEAAKPGHTTALLGRDPTVVLPGGHLDQKAGSAC